MAIDQTKLNPELTQFLAARQSALKISKTTTTPSGQTLDWIPIESQDPTGKIASPPAVTSLPVRTVDEEKPVEGGHLSSLTTRKSSAARRERFPSCARISRS